MNIESTADFLWNSATPMTTEQAESNPNIYPIPATTKRCEFSGSFTVDDSALLREQVPTGRGLVVWLLNRGCLSVYRMGIVPNGAVSSSYDSALNGLKLGQPNFANREQKLHWLETAITYNAVAFNGEQQQLRISPDIAQVFSLGRITCGAVSMRIDTESALGPFTPSGLIHAAAISDSRNVQQITTSSGITSAFDESSLNQNTMSAKDGVFDVPVQIGAVALCGPDVYPLYQPPHGATHDTINAQYARHAGDPNHMATKGSFVPPPAPSNVAEAYLWQGWITPWNVTAELYQSDTGIWFGGALNGCQQIFVDPINLFGVVDTRLVFTGAGFYTPPTPPPAALPTRQMMYTANFTHVFASCQADGGLLYHTYTGEVPIGNANPYFEDHSLMVDIPSARMFQKSPHLGWSVNDALSDQNGGMFIGTQVAISVTIARPGTAPASYSLNGLLDLSIYVSARSLHSDGEVGVLRVLRYDDVKTSAPGDVPPRICVRGVFHIQGVPVGGIVPFVGDTPGDDGEMNLNVIPAISRVYSTATSPYRRVWRMDEYNAFVARGKPGIEDMRRWLGGAPEVRERKRIHDNVVAQTNIKSNVHTFNPIGRLARLDSHLGTHAKETPVTRKPRFNFN